MKARQAPPLGAARVYSRTLRGVVTALESLVIRRLFGDSRVDSVGWAVRILYGSAWSNEYFPTKEAADARAKQIQAMGYPTEVLPPGPLPPIATSDFPAAWAEIRVAVGSADTQKLLASALEIGQRISRDNLRKIGKTLGVSLRRDDPAVAQQLGSFARANVDLIKSLSRESIDELLPKILEAQAKGARVEELRSLIMERFAVSKSRADLIARDQVLKLNGQITQSRQVRAGITEYIWSTSQDERVRASHQALNRTRQRWDSPPSVGHPGADYQCRCVAIPVLE